MGAMRSRTYIYIAPLKAARTGWPANQLMCGLRHAAFEQLARARYRSSPVQQAKAILTLTYVAYTPHVMVIIGRDLMGAGG
jgi:hypothetical protein